MSDLMLDVDQAGELKAAFRRGDWTNAEIKKLCEGDTLKNVRGVLRGFSTITPVLHAIDCDASPFVPDGWRVEEHTKGGMFTWDPTKVKLYLSKKQKDNKHIIGTDLRKELKDKPVLNANLLDYLLKPENQHLIPEEWKGKAVFFWGTIYRDSRGHLYVRFLYWNDGAWGWDDDWLGNSFDSNLPAVVLAS